MTRTKTNQLTKAQIQTLTASAKQYAVDENMLINTVTYTKIGRYADGQDILNRWIFIGDICYKCYNDRKKGFVDTAKAVFLDSLSDDEVNYSIRIAGNVKSNRATVIDTEDLKKWYLKEKSSLISAKRIVDAYLAYKTQLVEDAKTDEQKEEEKTDKEDDKEYSYEQIVEAFKTFQNRCNKASGEVTGKQVEALKELTAKHEADFMAAWIVKTEEAAQK